ncbi:MAG: HD domain-containing protein [Planctomycetes bacterium]|nr:HD domain-containing protein [Planctomycetota bacterium]
MNEPVPSRPVPVPKVVAVIDVGSSGIRMEIAELRPPAEIQHLESLHRSILLGNDTFHTGRLSNESIQATCEALRKFRRAMDNLGVITYRAVATNAVREAENSDAFIDRVHMTTGFNLEILNGAEQSRLTYAAVQHSLSGLVDFQSDVIALVEVGGGAVDVMLLDRGEAVYADTFAFGAIRIRQALRNSRGTAQERNSFLRHLVRTATLNIPRAIPLTRAHVLIALGGDVRFLAHQLFPQTPPASRSWSVPRAQFLEACGRMAEEDVDRLTEDYHLSYGDAATLSPALMIYEKIVEATPVDAVVISSASVRDGLLLDMLHQETGQGEEVFSRQIVGSAVALARKYQVDEKHATHVARLALGLFDALKADHGLGGRERLLLEVAAVLHEIGSFVHNRSHHKHTQYLIASSEIFGLDKYEVDIVANVARYHRRSTPQPTHPAYMALDRAERMVVCKLAAILRVADSLDKDHLQQIQSPRLVRGPAELQILVPRDLDVRLGEVNLEEKGDLFREIFGIRPVILPSAS